MNIMDGSSHAMTSYHPSTTRMLYESSSPWTVHGSGIPSDENLINICASDSDLADAEEMLRNIKSTIVSLHHYDVSPSLQIYRVILNWMQRITRQVARSSINQSVVSKPFSTRFRTRTTILRTLANFSAMSLQSSGYNTKTASFGSLFFPRLENILL